MKYIIKHHKEECIGCGACAAANPIYWKMGNDGKSDLIGANNNDNKQILTLNKDYEHNLEAAEYCPVNCIHIFKIEDNKENKVI